MKTEHGMIISGKMVKCSDIHINVSGGTERVTFFAGGSYYNEKGNYGNIDNNKYSMRTGMNATIVDGLTAR